MKTFHRILFLMSSYIILFLLMATPLLAQKNKPPFPRSAFKQVRDIVCKEYDEYDKDCAYNKFLIDGVDLNGDKKVEWFFYGPSIECGAHGNCPLTILQKNGDKWNILYSGWGNSYGTEPLSTLHKGYRDLEITNEAGPFNWTKEEWIWNGTRYENLPNSTTYYLSDEGKLILVPPKKWEDCLRNGCK